MQFNDPVSEPEKGGEDEREPVLPSLIIICCVSADIVNRYRLFSFNADTGLCRCKLKNRSKYRWPPRHFIVNSNQRCAKHWWNQNLHRIRASNDSIVIALKSACKSTSWPSQRGDRSTIVQRAYRNGTEANAIWAITSCAYSDRRHSTSRHSVTSNRQLDSNIK